MSEMCPTTGVCANHSGHEEKIKATNRQQSITNWMLGILIGTILTVGGSLYVQLQAVAVAMASVTTRLTAFEERIQRLDTVDQRIIERLDRVEGRR